jgi:hypothetical protein
MLDSSESSKCISFREKEWTVISEMTANIYIILGSLNQSMEVSGWGKKSSILIRNKTNIERQPEM